MEGGEKLFGRLGAKEIYINDIADFASKIALAVSEFGAVEDTLALAADVKKGRLAIDADDGGLYLLARGQVPDFFVSSALNSSSKLSLMCVCHVCFSAKLRFMIDFSAAPDGGVKHLSFNTMMAGMSTADSLVV